VGRGIVPGGGAADRRVRPVSGAWESRTRGRAWASPRRKKGGPSLDEQ
jgi:hypothetical protein